MRTLLAAVLLMFTLPSLADSYIDLYQAGGWPQQRAHFRDALSSAQQRYRNSLPPAIYQALVDNSNQRFTAAGMDQRALAGLPAALHATILARATQTNEPGRCAVLAPLLAGLVLHKRGRDESRPPLPVEKRLTNNIILKKLRVAFELRDDDLHEILRAADLPMTKAELNALFRSPEHKNYRACGDQLLRNFLRGLTQRQRG